MFPYALAYITVTMLVLADFICWSVHSRYSRSSWERLEVMTGPCIGQAVATTMRLLLLLLPVAEAEAAESAAAEVEAVAGGAAKGLAEKGAMRERQSLWSGCRRWGEGNGQMHARLTRYDNSVSRGRLTSLPAGSCCIEASLSMVLATE